MTTKKRMRMKLHVGGTEGAVQRTMARLAVALSADDVVGALKRLHAATASGNGPVVVRRSDLKLALEALGEVFGDESSITTRRTNR